MTDPNTDRRTEDVQLSDDSGAPAPTKERDQKSPPPTPQGNQDKDQDEETGTHGRPSDDSDPGHS